MPIETTEVNAMPAVAPGAPVLTPKATPNRRVFSAAVNSAEFFDHLRAHFRETRRTRVDIDCEIKLMFGDGTVFDSGTAIVRDFSPSGAFLASIKTPKGCYPSAPFKILMTLKGGGYNGIAIDATPVRLATDMPGLGVRFDEIVVEV
jgi:hypothetical protein